jgi:hypothetical protein
MSSATQLAEVLDPMASPLLQQELPGICAAFDEQVMREHLQALLFGETRPGWSIERCELDQATYAAGAGVILRYLITIQDGAGGQPSQHLITGRLFPSQPACHAYLHERLIPAAARLNGRAELAPFAAPVAMLAPQHMALYVYPIDAELPALAGATDRRRMRAIFQETLPKALDRDFHVAGCAVELVDYGRQGRCTLRYTVEGTSGDGATLGKQTVYGKLTSDGSGALAGPLLAEMRERVLGDGSSHRFNLPRSFGWSDDLQLSLLEAIPGEPRIAGALKARLSGKAAPAQALPLEEMIDAAAAIAAALHTSGIALGPRRALEDELAAHETRVATVERISPALSAQLRAWLDRIAEGAAASESLRPCFNHGDFTFGQILFDGADSGLVDFDSVCQAEPALDLGQFLTYMHIAGQKSKLGPVATGELIEQLSERFLNSYFVAASIPEHDAAQLRGRVAVYRAISLLRRAVRSWQKFKVSRIEGALSALESVVAQLP